MSRNLDVSTHFQNCNPVNIISRRIGNLELKTVISCGILYIDKKKLLNLDNQGFILILNEEYLKKIIHDGAQKFVNQTYNLSLPLLGSVLARTNYIRSTKVQLASDQIFYNLEAGVEIRPNSGLLPDIFGIVQVESSLRLHTCDELS